MNKFKWYFLFSSIILVMAYSNCSPPPSKFKSILDNKNTSTVGNPFVAEKLLTASCETLVRCFSTLDQSTCETNLSQVAGYSSALGLSSGYDTLSTILQAEAAKQLSGNQMTSDACETHVENLACSSPAVQMAYQAAQANPYASAPQLLQNTSCQSSFAPGVNIEVPVDLVDKALSSSNSQSITFNRTRTSITPGDYDGIIIYQFEIVAQNGDSTAKTVSILNSTNSVVGSISIPALTNAPVTLRARMSDLTSNDNYRIRLEQTSANDQLIVHSGKILIQQTGATQTKIYIPLIGGYMDFPSNSDGIAGSVDKINFLSYMQNNVFHYGQWQKRTSAFQTISPNQAWTLEAVMNAAGGGSAAIALFNAGTDQLIQASELSTSSQTPTLLSVSFDNGAANFNDMAIIEIRSKRSAVSSDGQLYKAGLWVKLVQLTHAEVYYRMASTIWIHGSNALFRPHGAVYADISKFSAPTSVYRESTGYIAVQNTPCEISIADRGPSSSAQTGNILANSSLTFNSLNKQVKRTANLNIMSPTNFIIHTDESWSGAQCIMPQNHLVIGF